MNAVDFAMNTSRDTTNICLDDWIISVVLAPCVSVLIIALTLPAVIIVAMPIILEYSYERGMALKAPKTRLL